MTAYLLAGPAEEALSLAAARLHVEGTTARATVAQSWRVVLDRWPLDGEVRLPVGPVLSLAGVTAFDAAGDPNELGLSQFTVGAGDVLLLPAEVEGMPVLRERQGLEIDYVAGEATEDVPADLRQAMLALVAYWYANRDAVIVAGSGAVVPAGFDRLVANYRRVRL
jgi:uncharacterized phiE125 gp8 family phage protein